MTASRYCCCLKYRSPRSRKRAFLASGDRAQPVARVRATTRRIRTPRIPLLYPESVFIASLGQVLGKKGIERLDILDETIRRLVDAPLHGARETHEGSVGAVSKDCPAHQLELGAEL